MYVHIECARPPEGVTFEVNVATWERPAGLADFAHHLDTLSSAMSELTRQSHRLKDAVSFLRNSVGEGRRINARIPAAKILEMYADGRSTASCTCT